MLKMTGVSKAYRSEVLEIFALRELSIHVREGEFISAASPRVLLADEPAGNLDESAAKSVMDLLQELHRNGATLVVATHSEEMTRRAEREVRIVDGRVVQHPLLGGDS